MAPFKGMFIVALLSVSLRQTNKASGCEVDKTRISNGDWMGFFFKPLRDTVPTVHSHKFTPSRTNSHTPLVEASSIS